MTKLRAAVAVMALVATSCGGGDDASGPDHRVVQSVTVEQVRGGPHEQTPSALADPSDDRLPPPIVNVAELRSGGPPPDGIPPIDEPRFLRPDDVDFLKRTEPVLALEIDGDARAYPLQILTWHEIVNDTVAGVPVAVTYCPLCNTAIAFDRRLGARVLSFGTSGMLFKSALVMYDRQTESLWSHFTSEALAGILTGQRLVTFPVAVVSWADWREAHPKGLVLSRDTGAERGYGRNPYPGYDDVDSPPFLFDGAVDDRLAAKERILGIGLDRDPVAVRLDALSKKGVLTIDVDGDPVTVWYLPGMSSALDTDEVSAGRDVGATGVFIPKVDGRMLTFERSGNRFADHETGSRWNVFGRSVSGPLAGAQLEAIAHVDTFWFAWAAYQPNTRIMPR